MELEIEGVAKEEEESREERKGEHDGRDETDGPTVVKASAFEDSLV